MKAYRQLISDVYWHGERTNDRTGVGTYSRFAETMHIQNNRSIFPIVTSKRVWWKGVTTELCWFLKGKTNIEYLNDRDVHIWDEWADDDGNLGPVYGKQLRAFPKPDGGEVDQLKRTVENIRENPNSRRHVMTLWNPGQLDEMNLPPCHGITIQFHVSKGRYLNMVMYQRSADMFLGVPFNISSYALFQQLVAEHTGFTPGRFGYHIGDAHVYLNHTDQVEKLLEQDTHARPELEINSKDAFEDYEPEDFVLDEYEHGPKIEAPVAV